MGVAPSTLAFCNGEYFDSPIRLPTDDPGFVWGATVTDRFRTYATRPFRLAEHIQRFHRSAQECLIPLPHSEAEISEIVHRLLERWFRRRSRDDEECVGILWATPRTFAVELHRFDPSPYGEWVRRGARLRTSRVRPLPPRCVPRQVKMRSRLHWWIAEQDVKRTDPNLLAVLVEENGQITETYLANVLLVRNERIISPPFDQILQGISLRFVQELCVGIGMSFEEKSFTVSEIFDADEILLTSTPFGVCGVSEFDGLPQQFPGKAVMALREAWSQVVGRDIWADFASPRAPREAEVSE